MLDTCSSYSELFSNLFHSFLSFLTWENACYGRMSLWAVCHHLSGATNKARLLARLLLLLPQVRI